MLPLGLLALLAGAGYGIPAAMGMGASATPALGPGLMEMSGAPTAAGVTATTVPQEAAKGFWGKYGVPIGIGAMATSPVASAMLGNQPRGGAEATPTSVGAKPDWDVGNFYPPPRQRMPTSLARLLMGIR